MTLSSRITRGHFQNAEEISPEHCRSRYNTSAFLARGECRTYIGGAEANTVAMYGQMTNNPDAQVQYFDEWCDLTFE